MLENYSDTKKLILRAIFLAKKGMDNPTAFHTALHKLRYKRKLKFKDLFKAPDIRDDIAEFKHGGVVRWGGLFREKHAGFWYGYDAKADTLLTIEDGELHEYPNGTWRRGLKKIVGY